ncbi:unnamed protein product [Auanema sp. JU1783]|nr:unnamed protein product [Auanema sp. JU1783]
MDSEGKDANAPPSYQEATQLPTTNPINPPYPQTNPNPMPHPPPQMYAQQPQTVIIQPSHQATVGQSIVIVHEIKVAPSFDPYLENCQYCHAQMITRRRFVMGSMACLFLFLSIIFFPFIFFICCTSFQDAHHYCSNCNRLIAVRRR